MTRPPGRSDAIHYLHRRLNGHGGIILLDQRGRIGVAHNTPRMAWAWRSESSSQSGLRSPLPRS